MSTTEKEKPSSTTSNELEAGRPAREASHDSIDSRDPNVVDWDGPDDLANPRNWSSTLRSGHVAMVSLLTLIVNLGSTMFAPGAQALLEEFDETNATIGSLAVTIYLLGFSIGPLLVAPLSELYGRLPIYHVCSVVFLAFTVGCALSTSMPMFLVFRFITGCAGAAPLTIGGGTVADVIPPEKRGGAMAVFAMGPLLGPVIGPVIGGFLSQAEGWRWTFWLLAIMCGTVSLIALLFMRETYAPVLLARKAARLRELTGNPHLRAPSPQHTRNLSPTALLVRNIVRPTKLLLLSPIVLALSLFCAFVFGLIFLLFTTFPRVFEQQYGFSAGVSGLAYLGLGIGMLLGLVLFGLLSDRVAAKHSTRAANAAGGGEQGEGGTASSSPARIKPEYRLPLMVYFSPVIPVGFFWYGWSARSQTHWIVPIIGTSLVGLGSLFVIMPAQVYLVDAFDAQAAASALAANTVVRSIFGTFLPLAGPKMYERLGLGWGNSLLGFVALGFAPVPLVFWRYGEWVRTRWAVKL